MKRTHRKSRLEAVRKLGLEARAKVTKAASRFEHAFESRVTRAMSRLGVPTSREIRALASEVASLKASVERLARSRARA
ncbi:MAG TPA: phasin family protein [Usitatibacter sp.]|nr:phasin family protein [Usitatibacter sp.]